MSDAVQKLRSSEILGNAGHEVKRKSSVGMPKLFLKAGVTARDTFQGMCQKVTGNGRDLIEFAYGILTATAKKKMPTSYGKDREVIVFNGIEITIKEKIWAAEFLANRGFGKADQNVNITATIDNKSTDELRLEALRILQKVAKVQDAINPPHNPLPSGELATTIIDVPVTKQEGQHAELLDKC